MPLKMRLTFWPAKSYHSTGGSFLHHDLVALSRLVVFTLSLTKQINLTVTHKCLKTFCSIQCQSIYPIWPLLCKLFPCNSWWWFHRVLLSIETDFGGDTHLSLTELSWVVAYLTFKQSVFESFLQRGSHPSQHIGHDVWVRVRRNQSENHYTTWMGHSCCHERHCTD